MRRFAAIVLALVALEAQAVTNSCHYGNGWTSGATVPTIFSWNNPGPGEFGLYYAMKFAVNAPPYWSYCNFYTGAGCISYNPIYIPKSHMPYNLALKRSSVKYNANYQGRFFVTGGYALVRGGDNECPTDSNWQAFTPQESCWNPGGPINPAWPKTP